MSCLRFACLRFSCLGFVIVPIYHTNRTTHTKAYINCYLNLPIDKIGAHSEEGGGGEDVQLDSLKKGRKN